MWIRTLYGIGLVLLFTSCKKEESQWDKEIDLPLDTSLFILNANYIAHSDTFLTYDFEIVQMNQLQCEESFTNVVLGTAYPDYTLYSYSNFTVENKLPNTGYSAILLMEASSNGLFNYNKASYYFSRFFEQYQGESPNKNIALATFRSASQMELKFHKESGDLYGNSAAFNDSVMYELIRLSEEVNYESSSAADFRDLMFEVMDTLRLNPNSSGEQSITIVDDFFANNIVTYESYIIKEIIDRANLYGIKVNVICRGGDAYFAMALGTNGFIIDDRDSYKVVVTYLEYPISAVGNGIANLDRILSNDLTVYKYRLTLNNQGFGTYSSGQEIRINMTYNSELYSFYLIIP